MGWNWQINKLPANPDVRSSRAQAIWGHLRRLNRYFMRRSILLCTLSFARAALQIKQQSIDDRELSNWLTQLQIMGLKVVVIWSAQVWTMDMSKIMNHALATITIALRLCSPADWPPLWGNLTDCWCVRQVWGETYHQFFRRTFDLYSNLFASSLLKLRKGSFASRYTKLYAAFFISTCIHWWFSFCGAADEQGNLEYFMGQAVAISVEDLVRWCWRNATGRNQSDELTKFERLVGYVWTFCWFTYSMPIQPFFDMGTIQTLPIEWDTSELGRKFALAWA